MSVLPAELKKSIHGERWAAELDRALDTARTALARRKTLVFASATLWIAILLSCLWVVLVRFTLLDVPQWPALLFPIAWLGLLVIIRRTRKVGVGESARFLDRSLDLDERVATSLEMVRSAPVSGLRPVAPRVPVAMLEDTTFHLKSKRAMMPSGMSYRLRRWQVYSLGACLVLLLGAIFLPTPFDQVRAERAQLQLALNEQIANVEQLRAELIERPGLDADAKAKIDQELGQLLNVLTTPQTDRSAILAAIADTQERLHALSPQTPTDFLGVVAAARTVQNATVAAGRNSQVDLADDTVWSPDALPDLSDLGKAADAASTLTNWVKNLNSTQLRALATAMERAQTQAVPENAVLAQSLLDTSESVAVKDVEKSTTNLQAVANAFLDADKKWQLAGAVEKALADLDDGRQTLAKAGADDVKKGQVGFRRPGAPPKDLSNNAAGTPVAGGEGANGSEPETSDGEHGVSKNDPSAFGQQMGSNSPDFSTLGDGQSSGDTLGQSGGGSASSQNSSTGGSNDGQSGNSAGGGTGNSPGTFGGQSTGVIGGSGGAISQVKSPQGQGITTDADPSNTGDEVYIPPTYEPQTDGGRTGSDIGTAPDQTTPGESREGGLEGRAGENDGSTQTVEQRGVGVNSEIRTPYKEVYGDYAKQAGQALEGVYIPADAKDYVKEYFTELGK